MGTVTQSAKRSGPRRIALFGNFGTGNLGNEASLEVLLGWVRRAAPEADVVCICNEPETVRADHGIATIPVRQALLAAGPLAIVNRALLGAPRRLADFVWTVRFARGLDAILVPGTGILDDLGERWQGMPYTLFKWGLAARLAGVPLFYVSAGAGPIVHPVSRRLMKSAARLAHSRTYRDALSKDYMERIGADVSRDRVYPDLAFALARPADVARSDGERLTVGVGVMSYYGWNRPPEESVQIHETYLGKIVELVTRLLRAGHRVRLTMGDEADWPTVEEVLRRVTAEGGSDLASRLVAEPAKTLHDIMGQMAKTDVVVATRFHNVVCALLMGKPVISLGYSRKNDVLLDDMGLGEFCQEVERFELPILERQLERLIAGRAQYAERIEQRTAIYREQLADQERALAAQIAG